MLDIRPKNLARDIIRPIKKEGIDTRNLDYLKLVLKPKDKCVLFVTFPASGTNWTNDVMAYVLAKTFKGEHGITFDKDAASLKKGKTFSYPFISPADSRTLSMDTIAQHFPELNLDHVFHTHGFWKESTLWGLDSARTVMISRHIPTAIFSYFAKRRNVFSSFEECLEKKGILERAIKFYNSWHSYREKNPSKFYFYKYEDCRENPRKSFSEAMEFMFQKKFDDSVIEEALDFFSFDKQKEREKEFNRDDKKHFHFKGQTSYRDEIAPETYQHILQKLNDELISDFGYDYAAEMQDTQRLAS